MKLSVLIASFALTVSSVALGETVGDFLKSGGKQANKQEATTALIKHGYKVKLFGYPIRFAVKEDNTVSGRASAGPKGEFPASGSYTVDDSGEFCFNAMLDMSEMYPNYKHPMHYCTNTFIDKDGKPFSAKNTSESSNLVTLRAAGD
jgi:hypothetical protein